MDQKIKQISIPNQLWLDHTETTLCGYLSVWKDYHENIVIFGADNITS